MVCVNPSGGGGPPSSSAVMGTMPVSEANSRAQLVVMMVGLRQMKRAAAVRATRQALLPWLLCRSWPFLSRADEIVGRLRIRRAVMS